MQLDLHCSWTIPEQRPTWIWAASRLEPHDYDPLDEFIDLDDEWHLVPSPPLHLGRHEPLPGREYDPCADVPGLYRQFAALTLPGDLEEIARFAGSYGWLGDCDIIPWSSVDAAGARDSEICAGEPLSRWEQAIADMRGAVALLDATTATAPTWPPGLVVNRIDGVVVASFEGPFEVGEFVRLGREEQQALDAGDPHPAQRQLLREWVEDRLVLSCSPRFRGAASLVVRPEGLKAALWFQILAEAQAT